MLFDLFKPKKPPVRFDLMTTENGEFQVLYINGEKVVENQVITAEHVLRHVQYKCGIELGIGVVPQQVIKDERHWPYHLQDLLNAIKRGGA